MEKKREERGRKRRRLTHICVAYIYRYAIARVSSACRLHTISDSEFTLKQAGSQRNKECVCKRERRGTLRANETGFSVEPWSQRTSARAHARSPPVAALDRGRDSHWNDSPPSTLLCNSRLCIAAPRAGFSLYRRSEITRWSIYEIETPSTQTLLILLVLRNVYFYFI